MSAEYMDMIRQALSAQLGISEEDVAEDSLIQEELGADSLDVVELLMNLEEATGISVPDEDAETLRTPADIVRYLENAQN